jgi:hypothetical protein
MKIKKNKIYEEGASPINKLAVRMLWRGEKYEPPHKFLNCFKTQPSLYQLPSDQGSNVTLVNHLRTMTGKRFGRLVVLGKHQPDKNYLAVVKNAKLHNFLTKPPKKTASDILAFEERYKKRQHKSHAKWVCRCDCGNYCLQYTRSLKNGRGNLCSECEHLEYMKGKTSQKSTNQKEDMNVTT